MRQLKDKTIIFIATVPWSYNWQRQHEWTSRLAENNKIVFVQPFGMNNIGPFKFIKKLLERTEKGTYKHKLNPKAQQNITFVTPKFIPWHDVNLINRLNGWLFARQIRKQTHTPDSELIFWICNPADTILYLLDRFSKPVVLYDIAMRFLKRADCPQYLKKSQDALAVRADFIITDSTASRLDLPTVVRNKTHYVPQGVNERLLKKQNPSQILTNIKGKKIIYLGAEHDAIDFNIFAEILKCIPEAQIIFTFNKPENKSMNPRMHYVGRIEFQDVPRLLGEADVGVIPYKINEFTKGVFPTKTFEYLAAGLPVVSTSLPELIQYKDKIQLADTPHEFAKMVKRVSVLKKSGPDFEFLQEQTWATRLEKIYAEFGRVINKKTA